MEAWKVAWKVGSGKYRSHIMYDEDVVVTYRLGEKTVPRVDGSPLFAYDTLDRALDVVRRNRALSCIIFRCEAKEGDWPVPDVLLGSTLITAEQVSHWWSGGNSYAGGLWDVPAGTILCKWIKPLEIVEVGSG